ncbi:hypothetical protein F382_05935 [Mannheimia haemolytica D153]|nr:hypothetical protein F382_05935 [Mannheimia haemolytica D153]
MAGSVCNTSPIDEVLTIKIFIFYKQTSGLFLQKIGKFNRLLSI